VNRPAQTLASAPLHSVTLAATLLLAPSVAAAHDGDPTETDAEIARPHDMDSRPATVEEVLEAGRNDANAIPPKPRAETKRSARADRPLESSSALQTLPSTTWRRTESSYANERLFNPSRFLLELRFGAYAPRVDEEFNGTATPYADFFGTAPQFYFGFEADWLPVRIPYVGSLGAAFGWGRVKSKAKAQTTTGDAGSDTTLLINPVYADAVLRLDALLKRTGFPLVPYAKAGVGLGMWQASGPSGTSTFGTATGEGSTAGLHLALGGALALNAFDHRTAMAMREETGIRQAYLWGEWMLADFDGFGAKDVMHVGASAGVAGLAIEY